MIVLDTPAAVRQPHTDYPPGNTYAGLESIVHSALASCSVATRAVWLPIYWTNNYFAQNRELTQRGFSAVPATQTYLDTLPPAQYATVIQCAHLYETVPTGTVVFSAGGEGSVPIPLLTHLALHRPLPMPRTSTRPLLASFAGSLDCGGGGNAIRHQMADVFAAVPLVHIENHGNRTEIDQQTFRNTMRRSRFALAPRGYGPTSFRLYEAMHYGCVPVYIYDEPWLPYTDELPWSDFAVLCPNDRLPELPGQLAGISPAWIDRAAALHRSLWQSHFSFDGIVNHIASFLETHYAK